MIRQIYALIKCSRQQSLVQQAVLFLVCCERLVVNGLWRIIRDGDPRWELRYREGYITQRSIAREILTFIGRNSRTTSPQNE